MTQPPMTQPPMSQPSPVTTPDLPSSAAVMPAVAVEPVEALGAPPAATPRRRLLGRPFVRRLLRNQVAMAGLAFIAFLVVIAIIGDWITPYPPDAQDPAAAFLPPFSDGHVLGTDQLGRDVLSRLIAADRIALVAAAQALGLAMLLGIPPGLLAGYVGRFADTAVMRVTDAVQSLPPLIIALGIVGALGPGLSHAMIALGFIFAPNFVRITRAAVLELREETFVEASRSIGTPAWRIVLTRIVPNALPPVLVQVSLVAGFALTAEASLSLLGFGVQPPQASWGSMLGQGYNFIYQQPWLVVFPGCAIALAVLAFNVFGDGLRDAIGRRK
jgi:peptide/nickel transport system permease protein